MKNCKSIKRNYILNLLYQIMLVIIPLIVTPYISRVLLPEGVGKYSFALSIVTYFTLFASFGFDSYAQREIARHQDDKEAQSKIFWEIIICRLVTVVVSLSTYCILLFTCYGGSSFGLFQILTLNIIAVSFDIAFFFQGNENFGKLVLRNVILKILGTVAIFVFVKNTSDLKLYVLINALVIVISNVSLWPSIIKNIQKISLKNLHPLQHLKSAFRLFIPTLAVTLYTVLDKTLIGIITKSDLQNGYYEQAEKIVKLAMTLITCLGTVMIPRNSYEIAQGNHDKVKDNIYKSFNFMWLLGMPITFGIILVAGNLVPWFLGENFNYSITLLKLFAPLVIIIGTSNILGIQYMIPYQKEKQYTISLIFGAVINFTLNLFLIYHYGAIGATIATVCAEFSIGIVMFVYVRKELSIIKTLKTAIKPLMASIIMFLCCFPLTTILSASIVNTCIIILAGVGVYAAAILLLKDKLVISTILMIKNKLFKHKNQE